MIKEKPDKTKIRIEIPAKIFPYPPIRILTGEIVRNLFNVSEKWVNRIELIVDELFNNAAEHGSKKDDFVVINFNIFSDKHIEINVQDSGNGKSKKSIKEIKDHILFHKNSGFSDVLDNQSIRGRGLAHIVSKWSDRMDIKKNKKDGLSFIVKIKHKKE